MRTIFIVFLLTLATQAGAGQNYWSYNSEKDSFTDEVNSYARFSTGGYGEFVNVRCQNKEFDVIVGVGEFIDNESYAHALYRVDANEVVESKRWLLSTDGTAIFANDKLKVRLASDLAGGKSKAVFKLYDYEGSSYQMRINLKGSTKSITKVMRDCNLGPPEKVTSVVYKCKSIKGSHILKFRVDRTKNNLLAGVQIDSDRRSKFFSVEDVFDSGEELTITYGSAKIYLNYSNMTARQAALFNKKQYVCE